MKMTRIVSVAPKSCGDVEENVASMEKHLQTVADYRPDFVCFTEVARELGIPDGDSAWAGEPIPGPTTERLGAAAREVGTHVVVGMQHKLEKETRNAAVLIGRDGSVTGVYHKVQPTVHEMERGTFPGDEAPVWETDRGPVGMCVCFDLKFPEVGMMLARAGARIVFFPSMFNGGRRHQAWTLDYGVILVVSQSQESSIMDMCGRTVARQGYAEPMVRNGTLGPYAFAEVNTDCKAYHLDYNYSRLGDIEARYGRGIRLSIFRPEATFVLESLMPDVSVEDIEQEFELEGMWTYYDRSREMARRMREGKV
jgi:hypothetical protein